ncbi:MAG: tRNA epoxyqueuosine(34) reductase QueG [Anaerolineales bacterium]
MSRSLEQSIKQQAHRLGFTLAGVTSPDPPPHYAVFENWLAQGHHGNMHYLADDRSRARRADPRLILPECRAILVLGTPYHPHPAAPTPQPPAPLGEVAAYASGDDYHETLPPRLQALVQFIEDQVGHPVPNRWYTDTGPLLERDLAMRAGLGWIGKNTCLINPRQGSYFFLAEILLGLDLTPDPPFATDHCGACTRCLNACPTQCILPNRTLDARRCISYLTIELKDTIPHDLRPLIGNHVFGCDICQQVCPWNRFARTGDPAFAPRPGISAPPLTDELRLTPQDFNRKFKTSPVRRAKRRGYLRNVAVALGNSGDPQALPALQDALSDPEPLIREHAAWAIQTIQSQQDNP